MYRKIVAALDGSELSESVLPHVRFLARTLRLPVSLLHVVEPRSQRPESTLQRALARDVKAGEDKTFVDYLKRVADTFSTETAVDCVVGAGFPPEVIVDTAAADGGALVAMATHGRSGVRRWLLGSVAEKVVEITDNPLFLVRGSNEPKSVEASVKRIVVPLDGSALAESAIPQAVELARAMELEIVLTRVCRLIGVAYATGDYAPDWEPMNKDMRERARLYLEGKILGLGKEGLNRLSSVMLEGDPAEKILELAQETPQTLIMMCTHGRSGVGRWVLGSVTNRVIRHSQGPVLVLRASTAG